MGSRERLRLSVIDTEQNFVKMAFMIRLYIFGFIALAPLPFASALPVWQWLWLLVVGLLAVTYFFCSIRAAVSAWSQFVLVPASLVSLFIVWGLVQTVLPAELLYQTGVETDAALRTPTAFISVAPHKTLGTALYFLSHMVFFLLITAFCTRAKIAANLLHFCGIVVAVYCTYGFIVYANGNETILWLQRKGSTASLTSTFVNRNNFAAYAGLGLQCLIAYAFYWLPGQFPEGRADQVLRHQLGTLNGAKASLLLLAIIVTATTIILSNSRTGAASIFVATLLLLVLSLKQKKRVRFSRRSLASALAVVALAVGVYSLSGDILSQRFQSDFTQDTRFQLYPIVVDAITERPLAGFGLGTFDDVLRGYRDPSVKLSFVRAHNDYLEIALTAGIPAAILLITACALPLISLGRGLKRIGQYRSFVALGIAVTAQIGLHSLLDFPLQIPAVSYLWCAILAASLSFLRPNEINQ